MSRTHVQQVLGKAMVSPEFRKSLQTSGVKALEHFDLTTAEKEVALSLAQKFFYDAHQKLTSRLGPDLSKVLCW